MVISKRVTIVSPCCHLGSPERPVLPDHGLALPHLPNCHQAPPPGLAVGQPEGQRLGAGYRQLVMRSNEALVLPLDTSSEYFQLTVQKTLLHVAS